MMLRAEPWAPRESEGLPQVERSPLRQGVKRREEPREALFEERSLCRRGHARLAQEPTRVDGAAPHRDEIAVSQKLMSSVTLSLRMILLTTLRSLMR